MTTGHLPAGWTLEEIRQVSGDVTAEPLDADREVRWLGWPGADQQILPETILRFHGLCLVRAVNEPGWYMGTLNDDGTIDCWSAYEGLHEALRGL